MDVAEKCECKTLRSLTSLLATLLIMILSGRSMVLAMVSTTRRA